MGQLIPFRPRTLPKVVNNSRAARIKELEAEYMSASPEADRIDAERWAVLKERNEFEPGRWCEVSPCLVWNRPVEEEEED